MAGGWGASIHSPMTTGEEPYIPGKYLPAMEQIAALQDASVSTLKRQGTLAKAMPPISRLGTEKFSNDNYRAIEALEFAQAMKVAHDQTKGYNKRMKKVADIKDKRAQKGAENFGKQVRAGKGYSARNKARSKALAFRNAAHGAFSESRHLLTPIR